MSLSNKFHQFSWMFCELLQVMRFNEDSEIHFEMAFMVETVVLLLWPVCLLIAAVVGIPLFSYWTIDHMMKKEYAINQCACCRLKRARKMTKI